MVALHLKRSLGLLSEFPEIRGIIVTAVRPLYKGVLETYRLTAVSANWKRPSSRTLSLNNETLKPFAWSKTPHEILNSVARFCARALETGHSLDGAAAFC